MSESFEVLSNYELRALFDKFGEIALKEGVADGNGGAYPCCAGSLTSSSVLTACDAPRHAGFLGGNYAYGYNGNEIFESFFGTSNPFASIVEGAQPSPSGLANHNSARVDS